MFTISKCLGYFSERKMDWLLSSLIALISWGLWGVFSKLASRHMDFYQIYVASTIITLIAFPAVFLVVQPQIDFKSPGFSYSILAGLAATSAIIAFYSAMGTGKASIVVPLTALYPIVTIIISYLFLSEKISPVKGMGIILAIIAIALLSTD